MVEIKKTTLSVDFPVVKHFEDYHDIDFHADDLKKLFGRKIGSWELDFGDNRRYWAVFYVGRKPSKAVTDQLLADAGFRPMYDDEE